MTSPETCPSCGAALAPNAPSGLCPACLFAGGLSAMTEAGGRLSETPPASAEIEAILPEYEVERLFGRGGMGAVYKARHRDLGRVVAIKVLPPDAADSPEFAERFRREARALAALDHPNIVTLHDFGERDGCFYFVMEFVDGSDLAARIANGSITTDEALAIVPQVCEALEYSHGRGVVHRDIKPANILIDRDGRVKIADFGLAKLVGPKEGEFDLTRTDTALGTPRYMAPEQMSGTPPADHRADIYALGVVFYELLTGEVPVGSFDPPSARVADLGDHFDDLVLQAMRDEPERRFQDASTMKTSIANAVALRRDVPGGKRELRRRFLLFRALPLGVIVAAVAGIAVWMAGRSRDDGGEIVIGEAPTGELADWHRARPHARQVTGGEAPSAFTVKLSAAGEVEISGDDSYLQSAVPPEAIQIVEVAAAVGANGAHVLALRHDGRVFAWGDNTYGQCEVPEAALAGVVQIAAGEFHNLALRSDGSLVCWGYSREGAATPPALDRGVVRMVAAGAKFSLALTRDGTVESWGAIPPPPANLGDVTTIGATATNAWAERSDGTRLEW